MPSKDIRDIKLYVEINGEKREIKGITDIDLVSESDIPSDAEYIDKIYSTNSLEIPIKLTKREQIKILGLRLYLKMIAYDLIGKFFYPETLEMESK